MNRAAFIKREAVNWLLILLPFIYILIVYDKLPQFAPVPLNWEQSIYYVVFFTMGVSFLMYVKLLVRPAIDPKTTLYDNPKSLHQMKTLLLIFTSLLSLTFISQKIGIQFNWSKIGFILAMVYMTVIGNLYPTIRFNHIIGIKNAWTRSNESIWNRTHRFGGRVFFWAGLIGVIYGILFDTNPVPFMPAIWVGYVFSLVLVTHLYSYILHRKQQDHHQEKTPSC